MNEIDEFFENKTFNNLFPSYLIGFLLFWVFTVSGREIRAEKLNRVLNVYIIATVIVFVFFSLLSSG